MKILTSNRNKNIHGPKKGIAKIKIKKHRSKDLKSTDKTKISRQKPKKNIINVKSKNKKQSRSNHTPKYVNSQPEDSEDQEIMDDEFKLKGNLFENVNDEDDEQSSSNVESTQYNYEDAIESHRQSLNKLKETDPEFYKFLEENDKRLLNFNVSDNEVEEEQNEDEEVHKPNTGLEVASDESDFEEDGQTEGGKRTITLKMLKDWQAELQTDRTNKTISRVIQAFHAALVRISAQENETPLLYEVRGSSIFNAVVQLCVLELGPAIRRFLGLTHSKQAPHKCKRFVKVKSLVRGYFVDLLKLLDGVTSTNILTVLLKHLHYMSPLVVSFPNITKPMIKRLVQLWGKGEETVRVVSFLCILRIVSNQQTTLLDMTLNNMYMTYIQNSKFVSPTTLPLINFMRRSLVEMFTLDINVAYQRVFLYIRQLAIHLRNAITLHRKEHIQAVYNWQYINSLRLWGNLLSATYNKPQLQSLLYPFVQVCLGTIKLLPTTQYYPLRFHVVQVLIDLSKDTGVFIPVLPFLIEVLQMYKFNKKQKKVSMKPLHFTCILRVSKSQLSENGFKDAVIEEIYSQLLEYTAIQSHSIAFPDLNIFPIIQIKKFLKTCSITNYVKKLRQVLQKIEQNSEFIQNERKHVSFALTDVKQIEAWETTIRNKGTPLATYYESWNKARNIKRNKQATDNEKIGSYNLPTLKKVKKTKKDVNETPNPFPSDSESDGEIKFADSDESGVKGKASKSKRGTRAGNKCKKMKVSNSVSNETVNDEDSDKEDFLENIRLSDW